MEKAILFKIVSRVKGLVRNAKSASYDFVDIGRGIL